MAIADWPMKGVWGWRGIMGEIAPTASIGWMIQSFYQVVPDGVGIETATLGIEGMNDEQLEGGLAGLDQAARRLAAEGVKFISLHGTPIGLTGGLERHRKLAARVQEVAGVPASTTLLNAVNALNALAVKKIVVVTPFVDELNRRHEVFWKSAGFDVINVKGLGLSKGLEIRGLPQSAYYNLAKSAYLERPGAEAIYMAGGPIGPPAVVEHLEKDLDKPVVSSTQAFIWAGLKALNVKEPARGYGRLFELR